MKNRKYAIVFNKNKFSNIWLIVPREFKVHSIIYQYHQYQRNLYENVLNNEIVIT